MNIFITGEKGLIAQNIIKEAKENFSDVNIVTGAVAGDAGVVTFQIRR